MHPYSRASIASALNSRTLSLHGALGRSKSSRENLLIHAHAALLRWLISCVSSPSSLTRPPKYRNWVVWAYFCPAASMTSRGGGDPPFFGCFSGARIKRVSVFFSDTVIPFIKKKKNYRCNDRGVHLLTVDIWEQPLSVGPYIFLCEANEE